MRTSTTRALALPVLLTAVALIAPTAAYAHPGDSGVSDEGVIAPGSEDSKQHDGEGGHLPAKQENVRLVGKVDIDGAAEGRVADVAAFGNYAYLTVRDPEGCSDAGVAVIDISKPQKPVQVGFIDATEGSFPGEGAQVLDVATEDFTGQVLLFNNEICGDEGQGGATLWDVTDPLNPVVLSAHAGDTNVGEIPVPWFNEIHSVLGWTDGNKAYAVIVDNYESADVDILDISDPRNPVLVSETDLNDFGVLQDDATPLGGNPFLHDVEVQEIDGTMVMVASYWDGGWVLLDVDDPANPVYLRDSDYSAVDTLTGLSPSEGNAHQAEFSPDGSLIVGTDEDFSPFRLSVTAGDQAFEAAQGSNTPQLDADATLTGTPVFVGDACTSVPAATGENMIAVVERGTCFFTTKAASVDAANAASTTGSYVGVVLVNNACEGIVTPFVAGSLPFVSVSRAAGYALLGEDYSVAACAAGTQAPLVLGDTGAELTAAAVFDGWGYVRLLDTATTSELGAYAIDEALDPAFATGFGDLSVHEVAVDPKNDGLAYLSYYSGGLRVIRYGTDGVEEVGAYIAEGGNNFWGVEVHQLPAGKSATNGKGKASPEGRQLVLASDRDSGLWIFDYTGPK